MSAQCEPDGGASFWELSGDFGPGADRDGHNSDDMRPLDQEGWIDPVPALSWRWSGPLSQPIDVVALDSLLLLSVRAKEIVARHITDRDAVQWVQTRIGRVDGGDDPYWFPHLVEHHDVLHREATTWVGPDNPTLKVYSREALAGRNITADSRPAQQMTRSDGVVVTVPSFVFGWLYIVSEAIARDLRDAKVTGARLTPAPLA
ncbi:hypothetical protein ATL41_0770 [Flavimobilis soli]|uniref:Uncharacterized protein n=1 Tax=Flavimobilis soli TaxID=442709 RepID=A0A2A9ECR7_9MICO|nr:hypothetical protein [Flavimobilis soli]PFG36062.1 hypothetical protein ATL41_0770 [Flavimobilis soli]